MSQEVFQIVKTMNMEDLQTQLALQCAPLLTGLKISNLFIVSNRNAKYVMNLFRDTLISSSILYRTDKKTTFLLFKETELRKYLNQKGTHEVMLSLGYQTMELNSIIEEFSDRYQMYMIISRNLD